MTKILKKKIDLKKNQIKMIQEHVANHHDLIVVNYHNLKVQNLQALKKTLKKLTNSHFILKIHKNTMMKKALENTKLANITEDLTGMNLMIHVNEETSLNVIKTVFDFQKEHPEVKFHKGFIENALVDHEELNKLAKIPTREVLLIKLIQLLKLTPYKLIWTLMELHKQRNIK